MRVGYHVPQNSIWVEIVQVKQVYEDYFVADLAYYYKSSGDLLSFEADVQIKTSIFASWEIFGFFDSSRDPIQAADDL